MAHLSLEGSCGCIIGSNGKRSRMFSSRTSGLEEVPRFAPEGAMTLDDVRKVKAQIEAARGLSARDEDNLNAFFEAAAATADYEIRNPRPRRWVM